MRRGRPGAGVRLAIPPSVGILGAVPSSITFDDSAWPLLVVRMPAAPSDDDFLAYLKRCEWYLERRDTYVFVLVTEPRQKMPKIQHVRWQAEWLKQNLERLTERCGGIAFVVPSPIARGALKTVLRLAPLPQAGTFVCETEEEAVAWGRAQLGLAGSAAS